MRKLQQRCSQEAKNTWQEWWDTRAIQLNDRLQEKLDLLNEDYNRLSNYLNQLTTLKQQFAKDREEFIKEKEKQQQQQQQQRIKTPKSISKYNSNSNSNNNNNNYNANSTSSCLTPGRTPSKHGLFYGQEQEDNLVTKQPNIGFVEDEEADILSEQNGIEAAR